MDYPFENLDPERFQLFCQSLITLEFPNVQCLPVAQPDGGRDALSLFHDRNLGFIAFQVKYVRKPFAEEDPHNWIAGIAQGEAKKVKTLIDAGAKAYYLITNVPGTAHYNSGSIDRVNETLSKELGIQTMCWWRDDLCRRLDNAWDLKWVYPELMTGPDLIRAIIESGGATKRERHASTIRAFLRDQYELDKEIRFRQVELQNSLLDLFVDVPIDIKESVATREQLHLFHLICANASTQSEVAQNRSYVFREINGRRVAVDGLTTEAATFLLDPHAQKHFPKVVLEGAPGQGKSTISQYVAQVHRMKLLNEDTELESIPLVHRTAPVRLPFRIDLRDLSAWLNKRNPFGGDDPSEVPTSWRKSLESFLAAQVSHHSQLDFTQDDLLDLFKVSAVLLIFDGLDEVANIDHRKEVVETIERGTLRLNENTASLQVIVTSRPAAFAKSPGLSEKAFPYIHLESLTKPIVDAYASKWAKTRKLDSREASTVKKILKSKLDQPHIIDLARNPMQLAILLSLIHSRGESLPDKRTSLYSSYMELFLSREAEKTEIVRSNRELVIEVHGYLAWLLHSEAEQGNESGSITEERLRSVLRVYLEGDGHDTTLVDSLFDGMVQRVGALVSRVQGTYEFEVQPLREYFVARYLYETARYSPSGDERTGTKPDRFDAISRNFYWLNVTRFFAGMFDKGELPSLIDRLQDLVDSEGFKYTAHPRLLAAMLLSDWVFTQHPKSVRHVVKVMLDGMGLRFLLTSNSRRIGTGTPLSLPEQCGRSELFSACFDLLKQGVPQDYALDIIDLIRNNSTPDLQDTWLELYNSPAISKHNWLAYGLWLELLPTIPGYEIEDRVDLDSAEQKEYDVLFKARRFDLLCANDNRYSLTINAITSREIIVSSHRRCTSLLEMFAHVLDPSRYATVLQFPASASLAESWSESPHRGVKKIDITSVEVEKQHPISLKCTAVIQEAVKAHELPALQWATSVHPWNLVVEALRDSFGETWSGVVLANLAAGIRAPKETCTDCPDLLDHSRPLCSRVRYARLRAGASTWWEKQLTAASTRYEKMLVALVVLSWASEATLLAVLDEVTNIIEGLSSKEWDALATTHLGTSRPLKFAELPNALPPKVAFLISKRTSPETSRALIDTYILKYNGIDRHILQLAQSTVTNPEHLLGQNWVEALDIISRAYRLGGVSLPFLPHLYGRMFGSKNLQLPVVEAIVQEPEKYPTFLVGMAESKYRNTVAESTEPVGIIARRDRWFDFQ